MTFALLAVASTLAALAWSATVLSAVSALSWRLFYARRRPPADAAAFARALYRLRALPALGAVTTALGLILPAFLAFEPRGTDEELGWPLAALASAGALLALAGGVRIALAWRATRRLARDLARESRAMELAGAPAPAFVCEHDFPAVALVGVRRPRLFVARRALEVLEPAELQVVLAHEAGHLAARDHLKTLLLRACPDPLALLPLGARMTRAYTRASEMAADDHACDGRAERALELASALVKLGRLAPAAPLAPLAVSHFDGADREGLAERVERLLARATPDAQAAAPEQAPTLWRSERMAWASALLVGALASAHVLRVVHHALEHAVNFLR